MIRDFFSDRDFYKTFFKLAIPVTIQYFFASSLNLVDNIMVGQLGDIPLAAVGLANQVYFLLLLFLIGVSSGTSIFASQFWGKKDVKNIRRVLGLGTFISTAAAFLFFLISVLNSRTILAFFSDDPKVIDLGSHFLQITSVSYVLMAVTACYAAVLRSTGEVKLPMRVNVIALLTNSALNIILVFGFLGFPRLGVTGSAIATVIARIIETTTLLAVAYRKKYVVAAKIAEMIDIPGEMIKRFISATWSVVAKDLIWAIGVILYMVIYAKMGTGVVAAINIVTTIKQLASVLFNGMASACLVMVGNKIGAGEEPKAFIYAKRLLIISFLTGIVMGIVTAWGSKIILAPYKIPVDVFREAQGMLFVFAAFMPFSVFNMVAIVGVLRSGGDTMFCLIMDLIAVYVIGMPLAVLGQSVWGFQVVVVFGLITLQEIFKFVLCLKRFVSKRWIHNLVNEFAYDPAVIPEQI